MTYTICVSSSYPCECRYEGVAVAAGRARCVHLVVLREERVWFVILEVTGTVTHETTPGLIMSNRAWVTLATNDSYGLGALVLAHSLRRVSSAFPAVVLITPSVTEPMRERLRAVFAEVITVDVLDSRDEAHLALLQRPELGITFTKIHCWNLIQYEKCVFLDADTLVVQNSDELFEREELSAAPDVGWPDCFNSGVFVFTPSADTFSRLITFAQERGSFDGGDQGLLNSFFSDWARGDINKHLPFLYNVTSAAFYSYLPALKHYGQDLKIIHFIGAAKPWLQHFNFETRSVDAPAHIRGLLQHWWDLFVGEVHTQLDIGMSGVAGNLARVVAGASHEALDDLTRRQGWEAGNIDYMGADSFDKIWAKITQTLSTPRASPPKQPSPPKEIQPEPAKEAVSKQVEIAKEAVVEAPAVVTSAASVEAPVVKDPVVPEEIPVVAPVVVKSVVPKEAPLDVPPSPAQAPKPVEIPAPAPTSALKLADPSEIPVTVAEAQNEKTEMPKASKVEPAKVVEAPKVASPIPTAEAPKEAAKVSTPTKAEAPATDSPPLANTPSKEEAPVVPAAKSEERRKPAGRLQLAPPAAADPLPTPDSEAEDAATLAHAIIAGELATPTVVSPTSPAAPALPPSPTSKGLTVAGPEVPTPPVGVSLAQIGVKPKETTAARIESSLAAADAPSADPPKKKLVKKVVKKEAGAEAPVPPPRKKEKKPKEK